MKPGHNVRNQKNGNLACNPPFKKDRRVSSVEEITLLSLSEKFYHKYVGKELPTNWFSTRSRRCGTNPYTYLFQVQVGLHQGCSLSVILFVVFMDRISKCSHWHPDFVGSLKSWPSIATGVQLSVKVFGIKVSSFTSKSEAMIHSQTTKNFFLQLYWHIYLIQRYTYKYPKTD